jgi:phospholipase C
MPDIKHLVVLMLENRSFDHMLGFLQRPNYDIDGIDPNDATKFNLDAAGAKVPPTDTADFSGDYNPDVAHDFLDVNEQVFGAEKLQPGMAPIMSGFVVNYQRKTNNIARSHNVMKCFAPRKIPVLTTLAQQYAVCTRWFSSVPGPTLPNRAYAHAATSIGHVDMTINWWKESKTIYELLADFGRTARIYYHDATMAMTFGGMIRKQTDFFSPQFSDFVDACKNNMLPEYSFIEPQYNASDDGDPIPASDQHPDHDVSEGEALVKDVYNAIRANEDTWNSTVLVIVYDEHGGLYDHVPPPPTVNPDGKNSLDPPFAFDRLGVRVPAVIVSPYIEAGTIDGTIYDHSSLAATARKLFVPNWHNNFLTQRDRQANTFDLVLTRTEPRTDKIDLSGKHNAAIAGRPLPSERAIEQSAKELTDHQQALMLVMASAAIRTQGGAAAFHREVKTAAQTTAPGKIKTAGS